MKAQGVDMKRAVKVEYRCPFCEADNMLDKEACDLYQPFKEVCVHCQATVPIVVGEGLAGQMNVVIDND